MKLKPGLVSITFRQLVPEQIIEAAAQSGLIGIEWGGDIHVPHGDIRRAEHVARQTSRAGLCTYAYGSYYRLDPAAGLAAAQSVFNTALALETNLVRLWAGEQPSAKFSPDQFERMRDHALRLGDLAATCGLRLAFEFHSGTLCDNAASTVHFLSAINHPAIGTYWQPVHQMEPELNAAGLAALMPWLRAVHVFHWWPTERDRQPLRAGLECWRRYIRTLQACSEPIFAALEYVQYDQVETMKTDADELIRLLSEAH